MHLSVCFAVLLTLAPLAVNDGIHRETQTSYSSPAACPAAQRSCTPPVVTSGDKQKHLEQAREHLEAAGLGELAAKVSEHSEREALSLELAKKVAMMRELQQEIAALRERIASPANLPSLPQQVMVQLKVLQVSRGKLRALGLDWSKITDAGIQTQSGFQIGVLNDAKQLSGFLEALESHDLVKVLAEPCLVTLSGRPATFTSGCEMPIIVPSPGAGVPVQFRHFGTKVDVLPVIMDSGKIRLKLRPEIRALDKSQSVVVNNTPIPRVRTYTVDTAVEVRPGQTVAIAGLTQAGPRPNPPGKNGRPDQEPNGKGETELVVLATPQLVQPSSAATVRQATRTIPRYEVPVPYALPQQTVPVPGAPTSR